VTSVPIIDLGAARAGNREALDRAALQIGRAAETTGFFVLTGHGIDPVATRRLRAEARAFFASPGDVTSSCRLRTDAYRGFAPLASEALAVTIGAESPPDLRELFNIGPLDAPDPSTVPPQYVGHYAANSWPDALPEFRAAMERYYVEVVDVTHLVTRLFALALDLPEHHLAALWEPHSMNLTVSRYPSVVECPPVTGQLWAGPHTDYGTFTLVARDVGSGGLQIRTDGEWSDVPLVADSLTVNIGDMLQRWTNDRWHSTMHRVVPSAEPGDPLDRLSIVAFHNPAPMSVVEPLSTCVSDDVPSRYPAISAGAHLDKKLGLQRTAQ